MWENIGRGATDSIKSVVNAVKDVFKNLFGKDSPLWEEGSPLKPLKTFFDGIGKFFKDLGAVWEKDGALGVLKKIFDTITNSFSGFFEALGTFFDWVSVRKGSAIIDLLSGKGGAGVAAYKLIKENPKLYNNEDLGDLTEKINKLEKDDSKLKSIKEEEKKLYSQDAAKSLEALIRIQENTLNRQLTSEEIAKIIAESNAAYKNENINDRNVMLKKIRFKSFNFAE
jgi:hypothetical protein